MLKNDKKITLIFLILLFSFQCRFFLSIAGDSRINVFYKLSEDEMVVPLSIKGVNLQS